MSNRYQISRKCPKTTASRTTISNTNSTNATSKMIYSKPTSISSNKNTLKKLTAIGSW